MVVMVSLFLIAVVAPLHLSIFHESIDRYITSAIQALLAVGVVIILIVLLGKMKNYYLKSRLNLL